MTNNGRKNTNTTFHFGHMTLPIRHQPATYDIYEYVMLCAGYFESFQSKSGSSICFITFVIKLSCDVTVPRPTEQCQPRSTTKLEGFILSFHFLVLSQLSANWPCQVRSTLNPDKHCQICIIYETAVQTEELTDKSVILANILTAH